jgi:integrase
VSDGIEVRHQRRCRLTQGGKRCSCDPSYRAIVQVKGVRDAKTFGDKDEARRWRTARIAYLRRHGDTGATPTVAQAMLEMLDGMEAGTIRARTGHEYKPSAIRGYRFTYETHIAPTVLSGLPIDAVQRRHVQALVDAMMRQKPQPSPATIRQALVPLQALYRRAITRQWVESSPVSHLELPAARGGRKRAVTPAQAAALVAACPARDRPIWATALYAGLRVGELRALAPDDVDTASRVIRVRHGFDRVDGVIAPKHRQASDPERLVPIVAPLLDVLQEHELQRIVRDDRTRYLFPSPRSGGPFTPQYVQVCADRAWAAAGLERLTFHECRHASASLWRAAGEQSHVIAEMLGHADEKTTDGYVHTLPDWAASALGRADAFLGGA